MKSDLRILLLKCGLIVAVICTVFVRASTAIEVDLKEIFQKMDSKDDAERRSAQEAYHKILERDIKSFLPYLLETLKNPNAQTRYYAAITLASAAMVRLENRTAIATATPQLLYALGDADPRIRANIARIFSFMTPKPPNEAKGALMKLLDDPEKEVREVALLSLGRFKPAGGDLISAVLILFNEDQALRGQAIHTLGELEVSTEDVVTLLLEALHDPNRFVRQESIGAIRKIHAPPDAVLPDLSTLAKDSKEEAIIREKAILTVYSLAPRESSTVVLLVAILSDRNTQLRKASVDLLGEIGPAARSSIPALKKIAQDVNEPKLLRDRAALAVSKISEHR